MNSSTVKSSTIFVAIGDDFRVFRSFHEVPQRLKRKLREQIERERSNG